MRNVISLRDARAARLKESLAAWAACSEGAIVRCRCGSPICARRIFCRDHVVVLIDRFGYQTRLPYGDILDAAPVRRAERKEAVSKNAEPRAGASNVIAFRRRVVTKLGPSPAPIPA